MYQFSFGAKFAKERFEEFGALATVFAKCQVSADGWKRDKFGELAEHLILYLFRLIILSCRDGRQFPQLQNHEHQ
jgi:hypothetical protein